MVDDTVSTNAIMDQDDGNLIHAAAVGAVATSLENAFFTDSEFSIQPRYDDLNVLNQNEHSSSSPADTLTDIEESIEGNDTIEEDKDEVDNPFAQLKGGDEGARLDNNMSHMLENLSSIEEAAPAAHLDSLSEVLPAPTTAVATASTESESESVCESKLETEPTSVSVSDEAPEAVSGYPQPQEVVLEEDKDTMIVRTAEEEEDDDPFAGL